MLLFELDKTVVLSKKFKLLGKDILYMIRKQLLYSLIFSYIAIFITGICLYLSLNTLTIKSIEGEIEKNYSATLTEVTSNINYIVDDMKRLTIETKEKNSVKEILFLEKELSYQDYYKFILASQDLSKINSYNSFIGETYIYYPQFEMLLNKKGTYSLEVGYDRFHQPCQISYEEWKEDLHQPYNKGTIISLGGKSVYIQSIFSYDFKNYANIVILFNEQRVREMIMHSSTILQGDIYIVDMEERILFSNVIEDLGANSNILINEKQNKKGKYVFLQNDHNDHQLTYTGVIPKQVYKQKISYINQMFILFTSFFIGLILLGLYLIYKKYDHMKQMIDRLNLSSFVMGNQKYAELDYIEKAVLTMRQELDSGKSLILENIFRKSLHGIMSNEEELEKYLGTTFTMSYFILGNLTIDTELKNIYENKLNEFIIRNVFQEVLGENYALYVIEHYKGYLLIANFLGNTHESIFEDAIHRLNVGRNFLEEKIHQSYILTVSNLHSDIKYLSSAYIETQKALEYRMFFNDKKLVTYDSILKEDKPYLYSVEDQVFLSRHIMEGNKEQALALCHQLFKNAFKDRDTSLENTKQMIADIQITLDQIAYELGIDLINIDSKAYHTKKIEEVEETFKDMITFLCNDVQEQKEQEIDKRIQSVISYIEKHYTNNNLTVSLIADVFGMQVSYLSRFFKEQTNENLLQYLTKYRIQKAKELLLDTDQNLNEIAQQVGLLNNVALIRSFKKYEYMTPNEYRVKYKNR